MPSIAPICTVEAAVSLVAGYRANQSAVIGLITGCFDLLNAGHVLALNDAVDRCHRLIVALDTDWSVRALKGPDRPIYPFEHRLLMVRSLAAVDLVVPLRHEDTRYLIERLGPDVLFKGKRDRLTILPAYPDHTMIEYVGSDNLPGTTETILKIRDDTTDET